MILLENVRYLGIDPSTKMGFVIINSSNEVIHNEEIEIKNTLDPERMYKLWMKIKEHLNKDTDKVFIEGFSFQSKGKGTDFQYGLGWILRLMLYLEGIEYKEIPPTVVKKFASGKGNSSKEAMILPIYKKWGFESDSDNIRDAFVLAKIGYSIDHINELNMLDKGTINSLLKSKTPTRGSKSKG